MSTPDPSQSGAVKEALEDVVEWLHAALTCKEFDWDSDQRELAEDSVEAARAALAAGWLARAEVAERADAARYRWIRDNPWSPALEDVITMHRNRRWDVEIDAAIQAERETHGATARKDST